MRGLRRSPGSPLVLVLTLILLTACGGGGGDSGSQAPPPPPSASLSYPSGTQTLVHRYRHHDNQPDGHGYAEQLQCQSGSAGRTQSGCEQRDHRRDTASRHTEHDLYGQRDVIQRYEHLRLSPDGTLTATSQTGSPPSKDLGTDLLHNGTLVTHIAGLPAGWLDNSHLMVSNYVNASNPPHPTYSGCSIYGSDGNATGGACALPFEISGFHPLTNDSINVPSTNSILSVSTGVVGG